MKIAWSSLYKKQTRLGKRRILLRYIISLKLLLDQVVFFQFIATLSINLINLYLIKDTRWEKAPSNETPVLIKSTNMGTWIVGTINQLFIRGS